MVSFLTACAFRVGTLVICLLAFGCQGSNLTLPGDGGPSNVRASSGSNQQGTVGAQLPDPLVVEVTDAAARPVGNVSLRFLTDVPGAEIDPPIATTNDSGKAEVRMRLGTVEGTQVVVANLTDHAGLGTIFTLTAIPEDQPGDGGGGGGGRDGRGEDRDRGGDDGGGHDHHDGEDHDDD